MCRIGFLRYVRVKINIAKWIRTKGYTYTFFSLWHRGNGKRKKEDHDGPLKLLIKLQWASFFLESSIMIDDRINKKRRKLIGALFDKLCHAAWAYRQHRLMCLLMVLLFFLFLVGDVCRTGASLNNFEISPYVRTYQQLMSELKLRNWLKI